MYSEVSNIMDGTITIKDVFNINATVNDADFTPYFPNLGDEYILSFPNLQNVKKFYRFVYEALGLTPSRYLLVYYRISRDSNNWTDWLTLEREIINFPIVDPLDPMYLEIKWVRGGTSEVGAIRLLSYGIIGELERPLEEEGDLVSIPAGGTKIIKPPYIFKVFGVDDVEIISPTGTTGATIKYRYSTWFNRFTPSQHADYFALIGLFPPTLAQTTKISSNWYSDCTLLFSYREMVELINNCVTVSGKPDSMFGFGFDDLSKIIYTRGDPLRSGRDFSGHTIDKKIHALQAPPV